MNINITAVCRFRVPIRWVCFPMRARFVHRGVRANNAVKMVAEVNVANANPHNNAVAANVWAWSP